MTHTQTTTHTPGKSYAIGKDIYDGPSKAYYRVATAQTEDDAQAIASALSGDALSSLLEQNAALLAALKGCVDSLRTFRNVPIEDQMWVTSDDEAIEAGFAAIEAAESPAM